MNSVDNDAYRLAINISQTSVEGGKWRVVNIAMYGDQSIFTIPTIPEASSVYRYYIEDTPNLLNKIGAFECLYKGRLYLGTFEQNSLRELPSYDSLSFIAGVKGYIKIGQRFSCYPHDARSKEIMSGQYAVLVNMEKLNNFIRSYDDNIPRFEKIKETSGTLHYLGKSITFEGKMKTETVSLLVNNIGALIPEKEFLRIRGKEFDPNIKRRVSMNSISLSNKEIRKAIESSDLNERLIIISLKNSVGLFLNRKFELSPPQKDSSSTPKKKINTAR